MASKKCIPFINVLTALHRQRKNWKENTLNLFQLFHCSCIISFTYYTFIRACFYTVFTYGLQFLFLEKFLKINCQYYSNNFVWGICRNKYCTYWGFVRFSDSEGQRQFYYKLCTDFTHRRFLVLDTQVILWTQENITTSIIDRLGILYKPEIKPIVFNKM